jgi:hypothetical protein
MPKPLGGPQGGGGEGAWGRISQVFGGSGADRAEGLCPAQQLYCRIITVTCNGRVGGGRWGGGGGHGLARSPSLGHSTPGN